MTFRDSSVYQELDSFVVHAVKMPHQLQTPIVLTPGGSNFLYVQTDTLAVEKRRNHLLLRKLDLDTVSIVLHVARSPELTDTEKCQAAALDTLQISMDPNGPGAGNSKVDSAPEQKGKGLERPPIIFDGLLPRIETRGQSRISSTKSGKKKDDISRPQDCVHQDESVSLSDAAKRSEPTAVDDTAAFPASRQENQD
ncbi:hypothetical protein D7B24_006967 [Verticillium nonalfalfae]|uniref:Uncharacterized protein n=1 Tax=Verticillium nonalfalfae TaxID=1051616 RepID=A0A3M9YCB2_9PEZI|nr:uncharacterized protein D7B24_006967 [Verticillium nonalfalfae]RNJ56720.1 hypothetical protein D7B24_006967 [Verticillium nonalfalfae]